jgi:hypothetical protein
MEENETIPSAAAAETPKQLIIDQTTKTFLHETAKWGKFLAIIGFVFCGFIVIVALFLFFAGGSITSAFKGMNTALAGAATGFVGFIYLLLALIYYFPSKYLFDFSVYINQAIALEDQESLNYAFERMKSLYKFWAILMIVLLSFYALIIVFAVLVGGFAATQLQGV